MPQPGLDRCSRQLEKRLAPGWGAAMALCPALLLLPGPSRAAGLFDGFKDPIDGQFDTSDWLLNRRGFLPVPIIITEPTIGHGGGLASDEPLGLPPSVSTAFGAGTENGTWIAGGGRGAG